MFKPSPVVAACALLVWAGAAQAQSQTPPADQQLDTVVVSGIRKGIEAAIAMKKNSDLIIEAVSAEDIGKLPDIDIADSLARLPGVTAQRDQYGRATQISIRGMGPDFVGTTLNGREQTSTTDTRAVDYSSYPSELVNAAVVYKTPDASLIGQGIAGTVDIRTVNPLDFSKRQIAINYRTEKLGEGLPKAGSGNRASFSYIDQFADRTIGVAFGIARLNDTGGTTDDSGTWGTGTIKYNGSTVNLPYGGLNENSDQDTQTRTGAVAVLEFKPNANFHSKMDFFYSKFKDDDRAWNFQMNLTGAVSTCYGSAAPCNASNPNYVIRQPQPTLVNPVFAAGSTTNVISGTLDGIRPVIQNIAIGSNQELKSFGWNNTLKVNDRWTVSGDLNVNTASNQQFDIESYASTPTVTGGATPNTTNISFNSNTLAIGSSLNFANRTNTNFTDVLGWSCCQQEQPGYIKYPLTQDTMDAVHLKAHYDFQENNWFSGADLGLNYSSRGKANSTDEGYLWVKGSNGALYSNGTNIPGSGLSYAGESGLQIPTYDVANQWQNHFDIGARITPNILAKTWNVDEYMTTAYGKLDLETHLFGLPVHGNMGVQVVTAKQSSTAYATNQQSSGTDQLAGPNAYSLVTHGLTDTEALPSINLVGDLGRDQLLRVSLGRQMQRPNMADMNASTAVSVTSGSIVMPNGTITNGTILSASGGNPYLRPFLADAFDISYEKYFGTKAYFSAAGFYKHLDSFIVNTTSTVDLSSYLTAGFGAGIPTVGLLNTNVNGSGGTIEGVELAGSLPLKMVSHWLDGFGAEGSFSLTNSTIVAPNTVNGNGGTTSLPGLSKDVWQFTAYYANNGFEARISERGRSDYVGSLITNFGIPGATYIKGESTVDAQISYEIQQGPAKGLQFLVQGLNLSNTPFRTYTTVTGGVTNRYFGSTYLIGLNYKM
ncbi:MAG: TonB-dependent receptor [Pelomonas sp.]|nr:TonB-dependent receptor [Roseateles sp.]